MSVEFVAVGGAGEIGMNMYLYGHRDENGRKWVAVDCGIAFGDSESTPGVETLVPDPRFLEAPNERVEAIFLTHGHEDHVGAIGELWPRLGRPPIHATPFAGEVARRKLEEAGLQGAVSILGAGGSARAAGFEVSPHPVVHSIPESMLLAIRSPDGLIVHSGDFRVAAGDEADAEALRRLGDEGVVCLACESTNIFEPGDDLAEEDLLPLLQDAIAGCRRAVAATTFSSNVQRMRTLARAAAACGREVVVVGRSMRRMLEAARSTGLLEGFPPFHAAAPVGAERMELFFLVTGSQGEPRSALSRTARGENRDLGLEEGDVVIFSSSVIPGNELHVHRVHNDLARRGIRVMDGEINGLHVSGHAGYRELENLYRLLRPAAAIPIHGEPRHLLEHARLAREWGVRDVEVAGNGRSIEIGAGKLAKGGELDCARMYRDGKLLVPEGRGVMMSRRRMQNAGHVAVALAVDGEGDLLGSAEVALRGMPLCEDGAFARRIRAEIEGKIRRQSGNRRADEDEIIRRVSRLVRQLVREVWGKQPEVSVLRVHAGRPDGRTIPRYRNWDDSAPEAGAPSAAHALLDLPGSGPPVAGLALEN